MVYRNDGHFTRREPSTGQKDDDILPLFKEIIKLNAIQLRTLTDIDILLSLLPFDNPIDGASPENNSELKADSPLCLAVQRLLVAFIYHYVGSALFKSPILSFYTIFNCRRIRIRLKAKERERGGGSNGDNNSDIAITAGNNKSGGWIEPGNFNSYLSAFI